MPKRAQTILHMVCALAGMFLRKMVRMPRRTTRMVMPEACQKDLLMLREQEAVAQKDERGRRIRTPYRWICCWNLKCN